VASLGLFAAFLLAAGCGSSSSPPAGAIPVTLEDFKIVLSTTHAKAGTITFAVTNHGPSTHEMIIDRTDRPPGDLPLGLEGKLKVDEGSPELQNIGEVSSLLLGHEDNVTLTNMKPGHYVLFCNLEGHWAETMHVAFVVD
jgi:uncharacterized cupredoxin-like copper-binding protein